MTYRQVLQMKPEYRDYVWGGRRLRPGMLTAEAWVIYENNIIAHGPFKDLTLAQASATLGVDLLGERAVARTGMRFPLLIKLLDCSQWLSLQVHPDDQYAKALEGANYFGKTEAWHFLETADDAQIIAGIRPGLTKTQLSDAIGNRAILELIDYHPVKSGDTVFMAAGTIHALGPGMMVYEVQQTSDLTYRVYDWDRPQHGGRVLHIDKARTVSDPSARINVHPAPIMGKETSIGLIRSTYFNLDLLSTSSSRLILDTANRSFHALTVIDGKCIVSIDGQETNLSKFESVVIPAAVGEYALKPTPDCRVLNTSVK